MFKTLEKILSSSAIISAILFCGYHYTYVYYYCMIKTYGASEIFIKITPETFIKVFVNKMSIFVVIIYIMFTLIILKRYILKTLEIKILIIIYTIVLIPILFSINYLKSRLDEVLLLVICIIFMTGSAYIGVKAYAAHNLSIYKFMLLFLTLSAFFTYSCYFEYQARYEVESKKEYARLLEYNNKLILINFGDYLLLGNYEYNDFFDFEIIPSQDAGKFDVIEIK